MADDPALIADYGRHDDLGMDDIKEAWRRKRQHEAQARHEIHHGDDGPHIWCDYCVQAEHIDGSS